MEIKGKPSDNHWKIQWKIIAKGPLNDTSRNPTDPEGRLKETLRNPQCVLQTVLGITRPTAVSTVILRHFAGASRIQETALPVSMYSQVWPEARFCCYLQHFRRVQSNKGDTCLERFFGGPLASLGVVLGVLWASFGVPWDSLGVPWGTFGCPLGCLGTPFGHSWVYFGGPLGSLGRP